MLFVLLIFCKGQDRNGATFSNDAQEKDKPYAVAEKINSSLLSAQDAMKKGDVSEGADFLLEAVLLTKPKEYMPEGFENTILSARAKFQDGEIGAGVSLVSDAYRMIKSGRNPSEEASEKEQKDVENAQKKEVPTPVAEIIKNKIEEARQEFQKGDVDKAISRLLESILLFSPQKD